MKLAVDDLPTNTLKKLNVPPLAGVVLMAALVPTPPPGWQSLHCSGAKEGSAKDHCPHARTSTATTVAITTFENFLFMHFPGFARHPCFVFMYCRGMDGCNLRLNFGNGY